MATKPFVDPNAPKGGRQVQIFGPNGEVQNAQMSQAQFDKSIKRMRVELINKQIYMRAV